MSDEPTYSNTDHLSDDEFLAAFEACTLPARWFHHRDHIRLTWLNIKRNGLLHALARVTTGIRNFAAAQGKAERYHETITWFYVLLTNERINRAASDQDWNAFVGANPDLFDWDNSILRNYYRQETLASQLARTVFLFPDNATSRDAH